MGILMGTVIGAGTLVVGGIVTWIKKKEDLRQEKLEKIIREVDNKVEAQPVTTLEEMTVDVDKAICDLEIDESEDLGTENAEHEAEMERIRKQYEEIFARQNAMLEDLLGTEKKGRSFDEIEEAYQNMKATKQAIIDNIKPHKTEPMDADKMILDAKKERNWQEEVQHAILKKDWYKMENLFHQKYFPYPADTSPCSLYMDARNDGMITDELLKEAEKHYGRLWNYVGD